MKKGHFILFVVQLMLIIFSNYSHSQTEEIHLTTPKTEILTFEPIFVNIKGELDSDKVNLVHTVKGVDIPNLDIIINGETYKLSSFHSSVAVYGFTFMTGFLSEAIKVESENKVIIDGSYALFFKPKRNQLLTNKPGSINISVKVPDSHISSQSVNVQINSPSSKQERHASKLFSSKSSLIVLGVFTEDFSNIKGIDKGFDAYRQITNKYPDTPYAPYAQFLLNSRNFSRAMNKAKETETKNGTSNILEDLQYDQFKKVINDLPKPSRWHKISLWQYLGLLNFKAVQERVQKQEVMDFLKSYQDLYPLLITNEILNTLKGKNFQNLNQEQENAKSNQAEDDCCD